VVGGVNFEKFSPKIYIEALGKVGRKPPHWKTAQ